MATKQICRPEFIEGLTDLFVFSQPIIAYHCKAIFI
jgi:hypothetical protein